MIMLKDDVAHEVVQFLEHCEGITLCYIAFVCVCHFLEAGGNKKILFF